MGQVDGTCDGQGCGLDTKSASKPTWINGTVNQTRLHVYRKSYYAAISYTDYNIGRIVDTLDATGTLKDETVVVVFGDHGYQLGEHATWSKMTNFELGVHIPLIIRTPWIASSVGRETAVLAEMVDMFPTLAALAGLPDPRRVPGSEGINGTSLAPAIIHPANSTYMKPAAFSQFSKNNLPGDSHGGGTSGA
jgi:iduronate 2-sulfatase